MTIYEVPWIPRYVAVPDARRILAASVTRHVDRAWRLVRAVGARPARG